MSRADRAGDLYDRAYDWFDSRLDLDDGQQFMGKAFPAEDSFLLGEVALFSFAVLVLTGVFLGMFFEPSTTEVTYEGSVEKFQGESVPEAFASVLQITYDVPFGMFIRRMHHWAAHLFVASIGLHMLRVFFTGAYRNPRELNWVVGSGLAVLAMGAAYTGYALPFDEFASTATGIGYNVAKSVPVVGGVAAKVVFGGAFPSSETIPRLYFLHVLVIPLLIAGGLAVHMAILIRQKHTEAPRDADVPGPSGRAGGAGSGDSGNVAADGTGTIDRDDDTVIVGLPAVPNQAAVSAVVFFLTLATLSLLAGFLPVHNVAEYGPNDPASTPELIMPDWFFMWLYGFLKLLPSWMSFTVFGIHVNTEFIGGVLLPGLVFLAVFAWPFVDYREDPTHFTANPLERPPQTAAGVAGVVFIMIASIAGMNNILAEVLGTSTTAINDPLTVALLAGPLVAGGITYAVLRGNEPEPRTGDAAGADAPPDGDGAGDAEAADSGAAAESGDAGAAATADGDGATRTDGDGEADADADAIDSDASVDVEAADADAATDADTTDDTAEVDDDD